MRKELSNIGDVRASGYREYRDIIAVADGFDESVFNPVRSDVVRGDAGLFASIFTVDPVTNLPSGDLGMYMSDKTSPEVRLFIEQQLMRDAGDDGSSVQSADLSDDDIVAYSRKHGESVDAYRHRVYDMLVSDIKSQSSGDDK